MLSSLVGTRFQLIQWGFVVFSCIRMLQYFVSLFGHFSLSMTAFVCNSVLGISLGNTSQGMLVEIYLIMVVCRTNHFLTVYAHNVPSDWHWLSKCWYNDVVRRYSPQTYIWHYNESTSTHYPLRRNVSARISLRGASGLPRSKCGPGAYFPGRQRSAAPTQDEVKWLF